MTVEEKAVKVKEYCRDTNGDQCILVNKNWEHSVGACECNGICLCICEATEAELDRALDLIAKESNLQPVAGMPEPCVLEQVAEDAGTVIKINSNRKIDSITIEFAEEV